MSTSATKLRIKCGAFDKDVTLTDAQNRLVTRNDAILVINGAPGTGKTVSLIAKGFDWLKGGDDVIVLAMHGGSLPTSRFIFHVLSEGRDISQGPLFPKDRTWGHVTFEFVHVTSAGSVQHALSAIQKLGQRDLHIILDNAVPEGEHASVLMQDFLAQLKLKIPGLHLWAADWYMQTPAGFSTCVLDQPLRYPSPLLFEVFVAIQVMRELNMLPPGCGFAEFDVTSLHPPGPDVIHLRHQGKGEEDKWPVFSEECGKKVAKVLKDMGVGGPGAGEGGKKRSYECRDVLVLCRNNLDYSMPPAFLRGMEASGLPCKLFGSGNQGQLFDVYDELILGKEDKIMVANQAAAIGMDRKVVVCLVGAMEPGEHWQLTEEEERDINEGGASTMTFQGQQGIGFTVTQRPSEKEREEERRRREGRQRAMMELKHRLSIYTRCTQQLIVVHLPKGIEPGPGGSASYDKKKKAKCSIL